MAEALDATVVIPTRGRWGLLSTAALPSALEQAGVEHEVIVVDDGSRDETPARLAALGHPRLRVITHERSRGVAQARNAGIAAAHGRWVSFLDDDDVWSPDKLRGQIEAAEAAGAVFAYAAGAGLDARRRFLFAVAPPDPGTVAHQLLRWNVIWCGCSNVMARTELVHELGGFDEELFQLADWDMWIRLAFSGPAAAVGEVLVGYVMHDESMLLTDRRDVFPELDLLAAKHRALSERHGIDFDRAIFSRWVARGHHRAGRRARAAATYARGAVRHRDPGALARAVGSLVPEGVASAARGLVMPNRRTDPGDSSLAEPAWLPRFQDRASVSASSAAVAPSDRSDGPTLP